VHRQVSMTKSTGYHQSKKGKITLKKSKQLPQEGQKDCSYCYSINSNLHEKYYCEKCRINMYKECAKCAQPLPFKECFYLDKLNCNNCIKKKLKNKELYEARKLKKQQLKARSESFIHYQ